jgi:hypothetical protein
LDESAPRGITNGLGQMMILRHPFNVQVFNGDFVILPESFKRFFMREVLALPLHFKMLFGKQFNRFLALCAAPLLTANRTLRHFKFAFRFPQVARIGSRCAVGKRGEVLQAGSQANGCAGLGQFTGRHIVNVNRENDIPTISFAPNGAVF